MGLSGLGYNGHAFWDTELWMYPSLLLLQPDIAKSLLEYRYQRLETAKNNAFSHGYKGAMFPWESAASGNEETPVWALSGPFEHHITADIAIAAMASWRSGYAEDCKSLYPGSIPGDASILSRGKVRGFPPRFFLSAPESGQ